MNFNKIIKKIVGDFSDDEKDDYVSNYSDNNNYAEYGKNDRYYQQTNNKNNVDNGNNDDFSTVSFQENSDDIFDNTKLNIKIELYEDTSHVYIKAIMYGVNEDDIYIDISRDAVIISGKRDNNHIVEDEAYFEQELEWGEFFREIPLPREIDIDNSTASLDNGILFIKMKKTDRYRKRKLVPND